jgi:hypothetical protein
MIGMLTIYSKRFLENVTIEELSPCVLRSSFSRGPQFQWADTISLDIRERFTYIRHKVKCRRRRPE